MYCVLVLLVTICQCLVGDFSPVKAAPRRTSDGFPLQRLLLLCAVIEKRLKLSLFGRDVYLNVVGGLRISEPSSDLAVAVSIVSSLTGLSNMPYIIVLTYYMYHITHTFYINTVYIVYNIGLKVKAGFAFIGEIGLNGEIRGGRRVEQRVTEAQAMGFTTICTPLSSGTKSKEAYSSAYSSAVSKHRSTDRLEIKSEHIVGDTQGGIIECHTLSEVLKHALDGDYEGVLTKRRRSVSRSHASTRSTGSSYDTSTDEEGQNYEGSRSSSTGNSGSGSGSKKYKKVLYSREEEAWMNEPSDMIPYYEDDE